MKRILSLVVILISTSVFATREKINLGVYHFPPYAEANSKGEVTGIVTDLVEILNEVQDKVQFHVVLTSSKRRYLDFSNNKFDVMLFENLNWGWEKNNLKSHFSSSEPFMFGEDVYITSNTNGKTDKFFDKLEGKSKIGMLGYHYKFAGYNTDADFLNKTHNMSTTHSYDNILQTVAHDRFEIGIISREYLGKYLKHKSELKNKILISARPDQKYGHRLIYRKSLKTLDESFVKDLVKKLKKDKRFSRLVSTYK